MTATADALWARALRAVRARGFLPAARSLTPAELAVEAARRGESRLLRLIGWYYAASYGRVGGTLSDDEAARIVAALEADVGVADAPPVTAPAPAVRTSPPPPRKRDCELCGFPLG